MYNSTIDQVDAAVSKYLRGEMSEDDFTAIRLMHGIYGQRQTDMHMIRVKVPGGRLTRTQLSHIGEIISSSADVDQINITTRQDLQFHFVRLDNVVKVLRDLALTGLTTREACGNTVRNVTACPLAGVCPAEHTDINPVLRETVSHFLYHPLTQHLPRKFKMSFSGCEQDCAQGTIHDLAVIATQQEGNKGFRILAGGGLGHKPHKAIVIEECIKPESLISSIEAIISLHHRYSDRTKRAKSRIKFLVHGLGKKLFMEKYRMEFDRLSLTRNAETTTPIIWNTLRREVTPGTGAPRNILAQRQAGKNIIPISIPLGDISSAQIRQLVDTMKTFYLDEIRTTQDQNLLLVDVEDGDLSAVQQSLEENELSPPQHGDNTVACPGTWSCRLGITNSRSMAKALSGGKHDLRINVSGCHNGCAQPGVSDIGLHGEAKRLFGRLIPYYQLHLGGNGMTGGDLAIKGPTIPAARAVPAINLIKRSFTVDKKPNENFTHWVKRKDKDYFGNLLQDITIVGEQDISVLVQDIGSESIFKVVPLGGGECAGVKEESIAALLAQAEYEKQFRSVFFNLGQYMDAATCCEIMLVIGGQALLRKNKLPNADQARDILKNLTDHMGSIENIATDYKVCILLLEETTAKPSKNNTSDLIEITDRWFEYTKNKLLEKDEKRSSTKPKRETLTTLDISNVYTPANILQCTKKLRNMPQGEILSITVESGKVASLLSKNLKSLGHEVLSHTPGGIEPNDVILVRNTGKADSTMDIQNGEKVL